MSDQNEVERADILLNMANGMLPGPGTTADPAAIAQAQAIATIGTGRAILALTEEVKSMKIRLS